MSIEGDANLPDDLRHGSYHPAIDFFDVILSGWRVIFSVSIFSSIALIVISFLQVPIYRAYAIYQFVSASEFGGGPVGGGGSLGALSALSGIGLNGDEDRSVAIATLQSRVLIGDYIQEKELMPILFEDDWDKTARKWRSSESAPSILDGIEKFKADVMQVSLDPKTGLVTVSMDWRQPERASEWVASFVQMANQQLKLQAARESEANLNYLSQRYQTTDVTSLRRSISLLMEQEMKRLMVASGQEQYAFKVVDPAVSPESRHSPKRALMALAGGMIGLLCGLGLVLLLALVRNRR